MGKDKVFKERWFSNYIETELPVLSGKTVAITGTTSGTGYWAAVGAIRKGATALFLLNRASSRRDESLEKLHEEKANCESTTEIISIDCDLMSFDSVKAAAEELNEKSREFGGLDVLINNAGIAYFDDLRTSEGLEIQMHVNFFSHFLLTILSIDSLRQAANSRGEARIVNHSSSARSFGKLQIKNLEKTDAGTLGGNSFYRSLIRYAQSKIAIAIFSYEFNRRIDSNTNIFATVADPGFAATEILDDRSDVEEERSGFKGMFRKTFLWAKDYLVPMQSASDGAMPLLAAAFSEATKAGDFYVPNKYFNMIGTPVKAIENNKATWKFSKEANILSEDAGKQLWDLAVAATNVDLE